MKKLVGLLLAMSIFGNFSFVFANESAAEEQAAEVDTSSQLPEGVEPLPETVPAVQ